MRTTRGSFLVALAVLLVGISLRLGIADETVAPAVGFDEGKRPWVFSRLAEANDLLRKRRPRAAARAFQEVFDQTGGTQWATLAQLGLAWSVAASRDARLARTLALNAQTSAGIGSAPASVVVGLLSAKTGDYAGALERLDEATRTAPEPSQADAIRLTRGYVLFWSDELDRAANEFDALANSTGGLADDARYAAAWSRWKGGAHARAMDELSALVRDAPPGFQFRSVPQRLVELDERAVLGDSTRRYRRGGLLAASPQIAHLLDSDGFSRARSALRLVSEPAAPADQRTRSAALVPAKTASPANAGAPEPQRAARGVEAPDNGASSFSTLRTTQWAGRALLIALLVLAAYVVLGLRHLRADSRTNDS